ncbi:chemotaxis protein CheA [Litorilituus lipolyticus]|uniref:Chemotaxis protein CheA n=1 Tax=Litorilituus lipolyticus TaxID=2491017 RepID=A0A502LAH0_9GAMM|nr:chemotaxis protein CheA [Litorilituus lipolyticus]TPH19261.1 chemotaxis protein CheA [Litorilituus lipolyticus]
MSLDAALETFYAEAKEHLESMEHILLQLDEGEYNDETLNDIFRSAHTIKGSAGIFALEHIVEFTHVIENVLDRARENEITIETKLVNLLFQCRDHIQALVKTSSEEFNDNISLQESGANLLTQLSPWINEQEPSSTQNEAEEKLPAINQENLTQQKCWHISLRLSSDCLKNGMDPISFITFLSGLGEIKHIETITDNFPSINNYDAETLYFAYEISLSTDADLATIENTFMFVQDDSDITILSPEATVDDYLALIDALPEDNQRLRDVFIKCGSLTEQTLAQAHKNKEEIEALNSKSQRDEVPPQPKALLETLKNSDLQQQKSTNERKSNKQIRIDSDRLDNLINLIGELVINQQRIDLLASTSKNPDLLEAVDDFEGFTEQIRDAALKLRMVQIGGIFQRFKRVVRDTAQELNKEIELHIEGAETELDRLMVEKLGDPLTHIIRNAMDHGLEPVEQRVSVGKQSTGQLKLAAYHEAGHVVIAISDDGKGIDIEVIRRKAIEKNIISAEMKLTDNELFHLIFHPGFSTASTVTNLSGRGVGMDVVKRNVESLQGSIEINSTLGKGSEFKIRLPLTLAIIDGFHVQSQDTHFIIPQTTITECIDLTSHQHIEGRHCIDLRGEMIPFLNISEIFMLNGQPNQKMPNKKSIPREELVIVQFGNDIAGIAVDRLYGEIQTVVKPLGPIFNSLKGIGGSTLLGNGDIAFILDIPQLIEMAINRDLSHRHLAN